MIVVETKMEISEDRKSQAQVALDHLVFGVILIYDLIKWRMKSDAQRQKLHVILAVVESALDEHELPELPLQSHGQNEGSLPFQAQGIESWVPPPGGESFGKRCTRMI